MSAGVDGLWMHAQFCTSSHFLPHIINQLSRQQCVGLFLILLHLYWNVPCICVSSSYRSNTISTFNRSLIDAYYLHLTASIFDNHILNICHIVTSAQRLSTVWAHISYKWSYTVLYTIKQLLWCHISYLFKRVNLLIEHIVKFRQTLFIKKMTSINVVIWTS